MYIGFSFSSSFYINWGDWNVDALKWIYSSSINGVIRSVLNFFFI